MPIYLGTIQAAFNALMRVSLRLLAEGSGQRPDLERYLQEPLLLFLPLRALLGSDRRVHRSCCWRC